MVDRIWKVYLSGEIHTDWRQRIADGVDAAALAVCETPEQVVRSLTYVIRGTLPGRSQSLAAE